MGKTIIVLRIESAIWLEAGGCTMSVLVECTLKYTGSNTRRNSICTIKKGRSNIILNEN